MRKKGGKWKPESGKTGEAVIPEGVFYTEKQLLHCSYLCGTILPQFTETLTLPLYLQSEIIDQTYYFNSIIYSHNSDSKPKANFWFFALHCRCQQ